MPTIPPLLDNGEVVTDYLTKAGIFNKWFSSQCTPIADSDEVPHVQLRTANTFSSIILTQEKMLNIIRALDPNNARGWDGVSPHMIKNCDLSIATRIQIIFGTCIREGIFPENWKYPMYVFTKSNLKISRKIVDQFPLFLFWEKYLKRFCLIHFMITSLTIIC